MVSREAVKKTLKSAGFGSAIRSRTGSGEIIEHGYLVFHGLGNEYVLVETSYAQKEHKWKAENNRLVLFYQKALETAGFQVFLQTTKEDNYDVGAGYNFLSVQKPKK